MEEQLHSLTAPKKISDPFRRDGLFFFFFLNSVNSSPKQPYFGGAHFTLENQPGQVSQQPSEEDGNMDNAEDGQGTDGLALSRGITARTNGGPPRRGSRPRPRRPHPAKGAGSAAPDRPAWESSHLCIPAPRTDEPLWPSRRRHGDQSPPHPRPPWGRRSAVPPWPPALLRQEPGQGLPSPGDEERKGRGRMKRCERRKSPGSRAGAEPCPGGPHPSLCRTSRPPACLPGCSGRSSPARRVSASRLSPSFSRN